MRNGRCNQIGKTWLHHPMISCQKKKTMIIVTFALTLVTTIMIIMRMITRSYRHIVSHSCYDYFLPLHKIWSQIYLLVELYPGPMIPSLTTTKLNPSWAPEARSKILRRSQNVPARTLSWSHDPCRLWPSNINDNFTFHGWVVRENGSWRQIGELSPHLVY